MSEVCQGSGSTGAGHAPAVLALNQAEVAQAANHSETAAAAAKIRLGNLTDTEGGFSISFFSHQQPSRKKSCDQ